VTADYLGRARQHAASRDVELRRSRRISRLRLAAFLGGLSCLIWTLERGADPLWLTGAALIFGVFGGLVVWHARVEDRAAWHDALRVASERAVARIERRWDDLPPADAPASVDPTHHPYAVDLDLFGRASLFQLLGPAATPRGSTLLAAWLLAPAGPEVVRARQAAVAELAPMDDWREQLAAHGILARDARHREIDAFVAWAEASSLPSVNFAGRGGWHATIFLDLPLRVLVYTLTAAIWILLALFLTGVIDAAVWLIPVVLGLILSFAMATTTQSAFDRAGAGQHALARYAGLFEHASAPPFQTAALRDLHGRLTADGVAAPACMRKLNRILGFAALRSGAAILHFPIQALTLWDFHVLFALDRWRRTAGVRVRAWLEAIGELDALSALAGARRDNPDWCTPEIGAPAVLAAQALGHPLIATERRVTNDVEVGPPGTLLLVTGSNMSGKSTLLRSIGLNVVLAQAGGCVCAARLRMPPLDLQSSIRIQDSLELGLSYFMAALARLKGVVDAAEQPRQGHVLLYLLDEVLQGTNSAERSIAVRAVARHLLEAGAIGAMTTHDLSLADEEPLKSSAKLVHFTEIVDEQGTMRFDYRLREGIATSRNALRLMQMIGIDLPPQRAHDARRGPRPERP
jgi:predicted ATPase